MSLSQNKVPLGTLLQNAGLISAKALQDALEQQQKEASERRIGEILADRGHIDSKTADFFVERWSNLSQKPSSLPIGQYFKQAALLDDRQIESILKQQQQSNLKFGELAVARGWVKQTTVDFFLENINSSLLTKTTAESLEDNPKTERGFYKIKLKLLNIEDRDDYSQTILKRVLFWTGGQSSLTKKLFKIIEKEREQLIIGKEAEQIDRLVETKIIGNWRESTLKEHLQTVENRFLNSAHRDPQKLLQLYRQVLTKPVTFDNSSLQQELLNTGIVVKQQEKLTVANRIYQFVFNHSWISSALDRLERHKKAEVIVAPQESIKTIAQPKKEPKKSFAVKNLLLFLALLALVVVFINNITKRLKVRAAFRQGNQYLKQKSYQEAIDRYNQLLNIDSNYFQAWTNRGYALAGLQRYEAMRESCSTATIIDPTAVLAWNCQGEALHNLQREQEAITAFDKAIALNRSDPIFLINKSESLKAIGEEEQSLTTITEAVEVLEQNEAVLGKDAVRGEFAVALTFMGNGYRQKKEYETAISHYDRALEYSPNYFTARVGKGIVLNRLKRYPEARREFESILENQELSNSQQAQAWFYLGQTFCRSGSRDLGSSAFDRAIDLIPDYQAAQQAKKNCQ